MPNLVCRADDLRVTLDSSIRGKTRHVPAWLWVVRGVPRVLLGGEARALCGTPRKAVEIYRRNIMRGKTMHVRLAEFRFAVAELKLADGLFLDGLE